MNTEMSIAALSSREWLCQITGFSLKIIFTGHGEKSSEVSGGFFFFFNLFVWIILLQKDLCQQETEYTGGRFTNIDMFRLSIVMWQSPRPQRPEMVPCNYLSCLSGWLDSDEQISLRVFQTVAFIQIVAGAAVIRRPNWAAHPTWLTYHSLCGLWAGSSARLLTGASMYLAFPSTWPSQNLEAGLLEGTSLVSIQEAPAEARRFPSLRSLRAALLWIPLFRKSPRSAHIKGEGSRFSISIQGSKELQRGKKLMVIFGDYQSHPPVAIVHRNQGWYFQEWS